MKVNKIKWDKIKAQWDILKMTSAYIMAERKIIDDAQNGIDTTGHLASAIEFQSPETPEDQFIRDVFGNSKPPTEAEKLLAKAREVRKQLDEAIENDEYVKARLLQTTLDIIQKKYNNL